MAAKAKYLVLTFGDMALSERIDGMQGMAVYAKQTVAAFKDEPAYTGFRAISADTAEEAEAAALLPKS